MENNNKIAVLPWSLGAAAIGAGMGATDALIGKPYLYMNKPADMFRYAIIDSFAAEGDKFVKTNEAYNNATSALKELKNINDKNTLEKFIKSEILNKTTGPYSNETKETFSQALEKSDLNCVKQMTEGWLKTDREYALNETLKLTKHKSIDNMADNYKSYIDKLSQPAKETINKAKNKMIREEAFFEAGKHAAKYGVATLIVLALINLFKKKEQ